MSRQNGAKSPLQQEETAVSRGTVLSLCDRTGVMVRPWLEAGFDAVTVDLQADGKGERVGSAQWRRINGDVRDWRSWLHVPDPLIVFAFPPCTHLAVSGARWFRDKGLSKLIDALTIVEECRVICEASRVPYMVENPVGVLSTYWRDPDYLFDPCDFAGYADDPDAEAYTKRTCLWTGGGFVYPRKRWVEPTLGSLFHRTPPSVDRGDVRSVTPQGFARAVFDANVAAVRARREVA